MLDVWRNKEKASKWADSNRANLINQATSSRQVAQGKLVVILVVQYVHQISIERMNVLRQKWSVSWDITKCETRLNIQTREILKDLTNLVVNGLLCVLDLSHVKAWATREKKEENWVNWRVERELNQKGDRTSNSVDLKVLVDDSGCLTLRASQHNLQNGKKCQYADDHASATMQQGRTLNIHKFTTIGHGNHLRRRIEGRVRE